MEESGGANGRRTQRLKLEEEKEKDRISALPDPILQHILSFLPSTKEAIQTGILSKRWQNQWTCVPVLVFKSPGKFTIDDDDEDFAKSIDSTLLQHDCSKIKKLHLSYNFKKDSNFSSKIRFAMRRHVEELILYCYCDPLDGYLLPKFLFDNALLVKLEMINCYFMYDWSINWGSLKGVKMDGCITKCRVANVLHGSPSLESLEINNYYAIASESLKILILKEVDIMMGLTDIEISCPNLEELSLNSLDEYACLHKMIESVVSGCLFLCSLELYNCTFEKLVISSKSLKKLVLSNLDISKIEISCPNLEEFKSDGYHHETFKLMNVPSQYGGSNEDKAKRIFKQLQTVDELTMWSWFIKTLSGVQLRGRSYPWYRNKILTLDGPDFEHLPGIMCALHSSYALEKLVINLQVYEGGMTSYASTKNYLNSNGTNVNCLVSHLKTVEIIGLSKQDAKCKLVLNFIKFLLNYARELKNLVLVISKDGGSDFAFKVFSTVIKLHKMFSTCQRLSCCVRSN